MTSIAIMQPTFLPWIGYFDLMDQVDYFVFLDTVEFSKQSWQQRNKIKTTSGSNWLSLPVNYSKTDKTSLREARVGDLKLFKKIITTVKHAYGKAEFAELNLPWLIEWLSAIKSDQQLSALNVSFINHVCKLLLIETPQHLASTIQQSDNRHQRLIDICLHFNATQYISPPGAMTYLQEDIKYFSDVGIEVLIHEYTHPSYKQMHGDFISHLSILDLILNEGPQAIDIIRKGRRPAKKYKDIEK